MELALNWIAESKTLTALATIGGVLGLLILFVAAANRALRWASSKTAEHYDRTIARNHTDAERGVTDASYLIAVFSNHFLMLLAFSWLYYLADSLTVALRGVKGAELLPLHVIIMISKWILGFLVGDRAADILIVARRVKRGCGGSE